MMNKFEQRQLHLTCFLTSLILTPRSRAAFAKEWMMSDEELDALEIKSVPSLTLNMVIANEMRKQIGTAEDIKEFFFTGNLYLLDAPSIYADSGVILPIKDASRRNIKFLQLYRHTRDVRPMLIGQSLNNDKKIWQTM